MGAARSYASLGVNLRQSKQHVTGPEGHTCTGRRLAECYQDETMYTDSCLPANIPECDERSPDRDNPLVHFLRELPYTSIFAVMRAYAPADW
jgi:hypothetical protein